MVIIRKMGPKYKKYLAELGRKKEPIITPQRALNVKKRVVPAAEGTLPPESIIFK